MRERNYRQNCGVARAADLLGERWTLLIIRDLLIAPRRFAELEKRLRGMGTNLLAKRLREMREAGLLSGGPVYALTEKGHALEPIVLSLAKWGIYWHSADLAEDALHFPDWDLLALKALFDPTAAQNRAMTVQFDNGDWQGWVHIEKGVMKFGLGTAPDCIDLLFPCKVGALRDRSAALEMIKPDRRRRAASFFKAFPL